MVHARHPQPPTPAAAPSPRRRNTSATAASSRHRDPPTTPRRALRSDGEPASGVIPRPPGHPHNLIKDPALIPLRSPHIRLRVPRRDLGSSIHRKLVLHTQQCSPLRGHSYVRHGETFTGTFRESRRVLDLPPPLAYRSPHWSSQDSGRESRSMTMLHTAATATNT